MGGIMTRSFSTAVVFAAMALGWPAGAADLAPVRKAPAAPVYSWTGFYVGANAGYAWGDPTGTFTPNDLAIVQATCGGVLGSTCPPAASFKTKGGLFGVQAGYNLQVGASGLVGVEADVDWSKINGSGTSTFLMQPALFAGTSTFTLNQNVRWFGTVRARVGLLATSQLLLYGTGGFAFGGINETAVLNAQQGPNNIQGFGAGVGFSCSPIAVATNCFNGTSNRTGFGWTAGGGLEYAVGANVTVKAEYLYVSLGNSSFAAVFTAPVIFAPSSFTVAERVSFHLARLGLNFRW